MEPEKSRAWLMVNAFLQWTGRQLPPDLRDKLSMPGGMALYTVINFLGQKFLVFHDKVSK